MNQTTPLSRREKDVYVLISEGLRTKEIAHRLGISYQTARSYRKTLYRKTGIRKRVDILIGEALPSISVKRTHLSIQERTLKAQAYQLFRVAIRIGFLIRRPCEVCGNVDADGHHHDYHEPLKVRWLCSKHHACAHMNGE